MPGYCSDTDLVLGSLTMPRSMKAADVIQAAADEMNGQLGQVYELPIVPAKEADRLLLKTINSELATGSVYLAAAGSGNDTQPQAYGKYLVTHARGLLKQIVDGDVELEGVPKRPVTSADSSRGPVMVTSDPFSMVDAYYAPPPAVYGVTRRPGGWPFL